MPMSVADIATRAKDQLSALTGLSVGTVSSILHKEDGWHVVTDMVELRRIPDSNDILATYEVTLDDKGNLLSYERTRRYRRGQLEEIESH
jgi:hypothetical protein